MSEGQQDNLQIELKNKRICRFCLTQNEPLSNIYSRENRLKCPVPLPLQVMSCVSIEVFTNDGMPNTICDNCRMVMEYCYRFKQMCKKADFTLRQFPLTGSWPPPLEMPRLPDEFITKQYPALLNKKPKQASPLNEKPKTETAKFETSTLPTTPASAPTLARPKLLNKNSVKILNKNAQVTVEPILSQPIIKTDDAGNVEIVTEILEQGTKYEEPDPIKNAAPVETNVFPCPHCERSFPLRQLLDIHMVNHTRERSFKCNLCEKRFFSKYDLGKHTLIHTGEKPYECVVCKKAFTRSTLLHRHEKIHTDQPKFLCVYCEKPFLSKDELEKHTERHKKSRPFACKICGKCFAFKQGLERHETVHAKDQPYPCQYCDQSFPTPSKLSRHLTAHAGARPFPCRLCPNSYLLSHHLTKHMRSHTGSGSYKCYDCEKTFKTRDDLIYHSAVHATQTLVCPLCKEQFDSLDRVTEHIKLHAEGEQYACEFCDLIFMTADKLQAHSDVEHTEDLAVYEEHTKNNLPNVKKEMSQHFNEDSQDTGNEEGEVIEEFIIEEYHQDEEHNEIDESQGTIIKQESEIVLGRDIVVTPTSKANKRKSTSQEKSIPSVERSKELQSSREISHLEDDGDYSEMEIEALDGEVIEEPPAKSMKLMRKASPIKTSPRLNKEAARPAIKKTSGTTEINSVLQQLPKSVTVIKKERNSNEKVSDAKEIRVLNEKIIKKPSESSPPQTSTKTLPDKPKQSETKLKVQVENPPAKSTSAGNPPQNATNNMEKKPNSKPSINSQAPSKKLVEMMIGDRKVKVQKIMMTKAEVAAMAKEGKIEMKGGTMILKQDNKMVSGKIISGKKTIGSDSNK